MTAVLTGLLSSMLPKILSGGAQVAGGLLKDVGRGKIHSFKDFGTSLASRLGNVMTPDGQRKSYQAKAIAKNNDPITKVVQTPQEKMMRGNKNMTVWRTNDTPAGMGSTANYLTLPKGTKKKKRTIREKALKPLV